MAQSGYTPILIYASGTATNVPLAANMTSSASGAELALNYADGKLYFKNSAGVVTLLAGSGGNGPAAGSNTQVQFNNNGVFGASSSLTWDGSRLTTSGFYATGTGGFGTANTTDVMLRIGGTPAISTGSTYGFLSNPSYSGIATNAYGITNAMVLSAGATISNLYGYLATTSAWGGGATATNQYGFLAASTLTGATNNYGVASDIAAGTNRWNFYASGTASNYFAGNTTFGASSSYSVTFTSQIASNINFAIDNNYNIGASSSANRPGYVYVASQVNVGSALNSVGYGLLSLAPLSATNSFTTYTSDGLYGGTALPSRIMTPSNSYILFGYGDGGGGQYWPRMGFQNSGSTAVQAKNSIGNDNNGDLWIGTGTGNTEALRILASDQSVHVGSTYTTTGLNSNYLTASSIGLGNSGTDNAYLRRNGSGLYQFQTTVSGSSSGSIELQPYAGLVGIGTGGSGPAYLLDIVNGNNAIVRSFRTTSSTDYNGMILGAAIEYGSNNNAQNKWSIYWRGRSTGNGHTFNLYDELNGRDVFNMTPGTNWTLTASSATADSYLRQVSWGDLGVCTAPTSTPANPYPGFNFQGGGMVSPQVYDIAMHKNILYNSGYKYTVSSVPGAIYYVQNGGFTWAGTGATTGTAGSAASVSDYMVLTTSKNLSVGGGAYLTSGSQAIGRIYAGNGFNSGSGVNSLVVDNISGAQGSSRTVYFNQGQSGSFSKIRVTINLRGAGGWCLELNSGGTGGGGHFSAGGYINGTANYGITVHSSSASWTNAATTGNEFYVELTSNVGVHPVISGYITGSLGQDFGQSDITVTFS